MKLTLMKRAVGSWTIAFLAASPLVIAIATVMPSQGALTNTPQPTNEAVVPTKTGSVKTPVFVRNTTSAPERVTATQASEKPVITAKEKKKHDKKTISRCWKRLMDMAREANMAHRKKKD